MANKKKIDENLDMSLTEGTKEPMPIGPDKPQEEVPISGGAKHEPQMVDVRYSEKDPKSIGKHGRIDDQWVADRMADYQKYRQGKAWLEQNILENEEWWRLHHWKYVPKGRGKVMDPEPVSAWLFNSLANKHADAMDNFPVPAVLPREESDQEDADRLSDIIPCILEYSNFEQVYSDAWWYKLKNGTGVYGVFWDTEASNGLGDITVKQIDLLNLTWQPGIKNIQDSKYVFVTKLVDNDELKEQYPELEDKIGDAYMGHITEYAHDDMIDRQGQTVLFDCYYKLKRDGKTILHYAKWACGTLLYASENDTDNRMEMNVDPITMAGVTLPTKPSIAETGWYEHGMYPFIFDGLFPTEDGPVSMGYISLMKDDQMYIDKLNQVIMKNAMMTATPRFFKARKANLNIDEFADFSKTFVDVEGGVDEATIRQIQFNSVPPFVIDHLQWKVDELKETSGNRDYSQGSTTSGVTSGTAIAALQEAGSKLSRDSIKAAYRAYTQLNYMVLELIRQFYDEERCFRIDGKMGAPARFVKYSNASIKPVEQVNPFSGMPEVKMPIFDIRISAQKQSPFSRAAQNETAKELYGLGVFNPMQAEPALALLNMMDFEGIDEVKKNIQDNSTLMQVFQQLSQMAMQMAGALDSTMMTGDPETGGGMMTDQIMGLLSQLNGEGGAPMQAGGSYEAPDTGANGMPLTDNTLATKMRNNVASMSTPKV